MKKTRKILELLLASLVITFCYLRVFLSAIASLAALPSTLWNELALKAARTFLSAHNALDLFSKFPSSAAMSAFPNYECEDTCGFWHSFRIRGCQGGDYKDHILSDHEALVPDNDHILPDTDHFLPYPEYALHSRDKCDFPRLFP